MSHSTPHVNDEILRTISRLKSNNFECDRLSIETIRDELQPLVEVGQERILDIVRSMPPNEHDLKLLNELSWILYSRNWENPVEAMKIILDELF